MTWEDSGLQPNAAGLDTHLSRTAVFDCSSNDRESYAITIVSHHLTKL